MTAYMVAIFTLESDNYVAAYVADVPKLAAEYGGAYLATSRRLKRLEGEGKDPDVIIITRWPSIEAVERFLTDPRYQAYKSVRMEQASGDMFAFEPWDQDTENWTLPPASDQPDEGRD